MRNRILIVGSLPPPFIGPNIATEIILKSYLEERFSLIHLDTSDHREIANLGKLDYMNISLALKHFFYLFFLLVIKLPKVVYIPICQTVTGYLKDVFFILTSKLFGAHVIIHLRGAYFRQFYEQSNVFIKFIIRTSLKLVSRAIVLADCLRYIFEGLVPTNRIAVVHNGIDDPYKEKFQNKKYDSSNPVKILYLSNLMKEKGYIDILRSMPDVIKKNKRVKYIFAGEYWREEDRIFAENYIKENNLESYVEHLGTITGDKKYESLLNSDIFIFPSYNDGMPFAIIEAMSAGLPIITTSVGAIKEMVIDGENGFIVEKQNPEQIAQRIIELIENSELRKRMGIKSRERFLKYYTKQHFINALQNVFQEVLDSSNKR